ncbi:MAG: Smr/MutS family protein [Mariprofundaceae bacterium]
MADDEALFLEAIGAVRRLEPPARVTPRRPRPHPNATPARGATKVPPSSTAAGDGNRLRRMDGGLIADGVTHERVRRLKAGRPPVEVTIDLHGMTREEALSHLQRRLECGARVFCIIHGRGLHSRNGGPVLKQLVWRWLAEGPLAHRVLIVAPQPGSAGGACLVLLRR